MRASCAETLSKKIKQAAASDNIIGEKTGAVGERLCLQRLLERWDIGQLLVSASCLQHSTCVSERLSSSSLVPVCRRARRFRCSDVRFCLVGHYSLATLQRRSENGLPIVPASPLSKGVRDRGNFVALALASVTCLCVISCERLLSFARARSSPPAKDNSYHM